MKRIDGAPRADLKPDRTARRRGGSIRLSLVELDAIDLQRGPLSRAEYVMCLVEEDADRLTAEEAVLASYRPC